MHIARSRRHPAAWILAAAFLAGSGTTLFAQKKSAPAAKPAVHARPAKPSSGMHSGPAAGHAGPTTAHSGPMASHAGPSTHSFGTAPHPAPGHSIGFNGRPAPRDVHPTMLRGGNAFARRPDGRISDFHDARHGMDIHHGLNGSRRVSVLRSDHSRIFAEHGRPGYIQHPWNFHGHDFARRTYYFHGRAYDRFYRGYRFHGADIEVYAPARYFHPGFYGWAYNPWAHPVVYAWGWGAAPWIGYYGFYFTPWSSYPSAPYWLTDYMLSQDLAAEYQAAQEDQNLGAAQAQAAAPALSPEVKQQIAAEVSYQIALENNEAQQNAENQDPDPGSSGIGRLLADGHTHVFVAGADLDVVNASGTECALSGGDVIELASAPSPDAQAASLVVLASKGGQECRQADSVTVAFSDLQEMQNHMRETIDQGLGELQSKQGSGGLPPAPPSAQAPPVRTAFAQAAPPPDPAGAAEVNQQLQQADASEQEISAQAQQESGSAAPPPAAESAPSAPVTITLGQTPAQVTGALGQPLRILDLGPKKVYEYRDMKITFRSGKVADVQ